MTTWPVTRSPTRLGLALGYGLAGLVVGLAVLRVGPGGWATGLVCGAGLAAYVALGVSRAGRPSLLPADVVTFARALLACVVAALTVDALGMPAPMRTLAVIAFVALALDSVDGRVARGTGTASPFGARFDGEADAFLILVLSVAAAPRVGWWVVATGLARYAFGAAGLLLAWMRADLPFRYWRKVVTAVTGIALTVAASGVGPRPVAVGGCAVAAALLAESFGRDVLWLSRHRAEPTRRHALLRRVGLGATLLLAWLALVAPAGPAAPSPLSLLRLPVEAIVVAAVVLLSASSIRRRVAAALGVVVGAVLVLKVLDLASYAALARRFDLTSAVGTVGSGLGFVGDSFGTAAEVGVALGALGLVLVALIGVPMAFAGLAGALAPHRGAGLRVVAVGAGVWTVAAVLGVEVAGAPFAAADGAPYAVTRVGETVAAVRDRAAFGRELGHDPYAPAGSADLAALKGKDVLLVFVESYGRVALAGDASAGIRALLGTHTGRLAAAGLSARSAYLTSPTFGGSSWLAHSTLASGLRIDDQSRYDALLASDRTTLPSVFARDGWRTVAVLPQTSGTWPEGRAFYRFDRVYGRGDFGYAGPSFGFSAMPDQFTLAAFDRLELSRPDRPPLFAEIELTSSHGPWAPLPTTVAPQALGDGSVFWGVRDRARTTADLWSHRSEVPAAYRASIAYSLDTLLTFVEQKRSRDLVVVLLGDHQPSTIVTGSAASHDVPVTVIAHDPAVLAAGAQWGWQPGLVPDATAAVAPMAGFRDRFLAGFSSPRSSGG